MLQWLKRLFNPDPQVVDLIIVERSELTHPVLKPNDVMYRFPDPGSFHNPKVKFKPKKKRKKK